MNSIQPKQNSRSLFFIFSLVIAILLYGCHGQSISKNQELEDYYASLDKELQKASEYDTIKDKRIQMLKKELSDAPDIHSQMRINNILIKEYESYISDSALHYINNNLRLASNMGDNRLISKLKLQRIDIMSHAGLFGDALAEIRTIKKTDLDSTLLEQYYYVYCGIYQYQGEYHNGHEYIQAYDSLRRVYTDSLMLVAPENSFSRLSYHSNELIVSGKIDEAQDMLQARLSQYEPSSREYAIISSILAYSYKMENDDPNFKKYLAISAVSDIKGSTKENVSFRQLSETLFNDGDIERAKRYLQKSFDDANFYAARMRNAQSARMLPVIDTAYDASQKRLQNRLKWMLALAVVLSIILALSIVFILKQMKKIHNANITIRNHNDELSEISSKLRELNTELANTNAALKQSDSIKEEYAGLFMQFSSLTIRNLERYQQVLHNLAVKGNVKDLIKKIDNNDVADQTLKDFYNKFDDAILNIYPNFVEKVNALMRPDCQLIPKAGSKLNTELRVLALLRIGIVDSEKIAEFLRCSLTTVYTYRSKLRKRAINPDSFEENLIQ